MANANIEQRLFDLKNNFFLGNYQGAINEGQAIQTSRLKDNERVERDTYVYRSYIAQGKYQIVLDEIKDSPSTPTPLQAVKLLAVYLAKEDRRDIALTTLKEWMADGVTANNPTLQVIAATVYFHEGNYETAMRCVHQSNSLEGMAMLVQIYLKINRPDQAEKELKSMQQTDDDATLTLLATAWVSIALGGDKIQEAVSIYQDLSEKYTATGLLLNGMALCNLHMQRYSEAERLLLQALEKNSSDPETLVNLIVCYQLGDKGQEVITRQINQLKTIAPKHPWISSHQKANDDFDRFAKSFAP